jgi:hypothetical protein
MVGQNSPQSLLFNEEIVVSRFLQKQHFRVMKADAT